MTRRWLLIGTLALAAILATSVTSASGSTTRASGVTLTGAGSSFVFPLVSTWTPAYQSVSGNTLTYNAVGSGAGIAAVSSRSVDFGASDAPLTPDQQATCNGCLTIPWAFSGTAIAYNGTGLPTTLHMTGQVLADIYLGKITTWSDPAIAKLNAGKTLPDKPITPIYRSDASGTSYNFSEYLAAVSPEWKTRFGVGTQPAFPTGAGAAKSSGVSALLAKTDGGICYVDVAYALQNHFALFAMKNRAGYYVTPGLRNISAAADLITKATPDSSGLVLSVVDPPAPTSKVPKIVIPKTTNKKLRAKIIAQQKAKRAKIIAQNKRLAIAYPICTFTYVIVPKQAKQPDALKSLFRWVLTTGQNNSYQAPLRFVPLPKVVQKAAIDLVAQIQQG